MTSIWFIVQRMKATVDIDLTFVPGHFIWGRLDWVDFAAKSFFSSWEDWPKGTPSSIVCIAWATVRNFVFVWDEADRVKAVQRLVQHSVFFWLHWLLVKVLKFPDGGRSDPDVVFSAVLFNGVVIGVHNNKVVVWLGLFGLLHILHHIQSVWERLALY